MLHLEALQPGTFAILKRLMAMPELNGASLVGGTALALRYGHRVSVDLDLFIEGAFDKKEIIAALTRDFEHEFVYNSEPAAKWAIFSNIEGIKVDVVQTPHPRITAVEHVDGIRIYSDDDIGAMKIEAILHRAQKKDFYDLHVLLKKYGVQWAMDRHRRKYPGNSMVIGLARAMIYFVDAEMSPEPLALHGMNWNTLKEEIAELVNDHLT